MTARVDVTTEVVASPRPQLSTLSGQAFVLGATQKGPTNAAVRITGLADYQAVFGDRAGGSGTYDLLEMAFKEGLALAWVVRLAGPSAVAASKAVGTLTVTATSAGAWGNSITAQWTNATKVLTIAGVPYPGADLATLQAALKLGAAPVTVTGTLPTADVTSAPLTGGTDDAANAVLTERLALFNASLGDGAVTVVGKTSSQVAAALSAHCQATDRHGIIPAASGSVLRRARWRNACMAIISSRCRITQLMRSSRSVCRANSPTPSRLMNATMGTRSRPVSSLRISSQPAAAPTAIGVGLTRVAWLRSKRCTTPGRCTTAWSVPWSVQTFSPARTQVGSSGSWSVIVVNGDSRVSTAPERPLDAITYPMP